ncbi:toxin-antitoxin system HicB family antitoxin [Verminephrobacter eiseniae]|uniref:toxin-antitoxin system HicB family antitoxin n=1 Tax=Verminephrobacter eiseniae TaxID=364317 RepID=UPI002236F3E6|nr:toxin-antitoxin system HicB family antitoxin [Verminephrobacter eiseniae]
MPAAVRTIGRRTQATGSADQHRIRRTTACQPAQRAHDFGDLPDESAFQRHDHRGRFVARVPKSIHAQLGARAKAEGVSLNSLVIALIAEGLGRAKHP